MVEPTSVMIGLMISAPIICIPPDCHSQINPCPRALPLQMSVKVPLDPRKAPDHAISEQQIDNPDGHKKFVG